MDGGRVAARGFRYQYLRTVEAFLAALDDPHVRACRVEGDPSSGVGTESNPVDFDLIDDAGRVLVAAQVKTRSADLTYSVSDALAALISLVGRLDAVAYQLIVSCRPTRALAGLDTLLRDGQQASLRDGLLELVKEAPTRQAQIRALTAEELGRLARSRVEVDGREHGDIRRTMRETIRAARRLELGVTGELPAGLVIDQLTAEVLRRAADPGSATWEKEEFRQLVLVDNKALHEALAAPPWGAVAGRMPPLPDIPRMDVVDRIAECFAPGDATATVKLCGLIGLSGIGKSSLAAAYVAAYADAYDLILWVDANPSTIEVAIHELAPALGISVQSGSAFGVGLPAAVRAALGCRPGRWLLVFDDADHPDTVHSWIPRVGVGDVIVTSTNAAVSWRADELVQVEAMADDDAVALLAERMRHTPGWTAADVRDDLLAVAHALSNWPLALELAAAYMIGCGLSPRDVSHYVNELKLRSLDDEHGVPVGYPRTLVQAFNLALERLREDWGQTPYFAMAIESMYPAGYLAERRIPTSLLIAAMYVDRGDLPADNFGPVVPDNDQAPTPEIFRPLISASLVRYDHDLPPTTPDIPFANKTISTNAVIQEIVRSRIEHHDGRATILDNTAFHLERWLTSAYEKDEPARLAAIIPHAKQVAEHVVRLEVATESAALLMGNLAEQYLRGGRYVDARRYLDEELRCVARMDSPAEYLLRQTQLSRAVVDAWDDSAPAQAKEQALRALEEIYFYLRSIVAADDSSTPASWNASNLASKAYVSLLHLEEYESLDERAVQLRLAYEDLLTLIPDAPAGRAMKAFLRAQRLITEGKDAAAERLCRACIEDRSIPVDARYDFRRMLAEVLVHQHRWQDLWAELDYLLPPSGDRGATQVAAELLLHNVGLACAMFAFQHQEAVPILRALLRRVGSMSLDSASVWSWKKAIMEFVVALDDRDSETATALLGRILHLPEDMNADDEQAEAWMQVVPLILRQAQAHGIILIRPAERERPAAGSTDAPPT